MLVIRLQRTGRENTPTYRLVVAEKARPVKGKFLEVLGHFLPARTSTIALCIGSSRERSPATPLLACSRKKVSKTWISSSSVTRNRRARKKLRQKLPLLLHQLQLQRLLQSRRLLRFQSKHQQQKHQPPNKDKVPSTKCQVLFLVFGTWPLVLGTSK